MPKTRQKVCVHPFCNAVIVLFHNKQVSLYARVTFLKNVAQIEHKI